VGRANYRRPLLDALAHGLLALFALDRLLKLAAVVHFFHRSPPPVPSAWRAVTLVQPITRSPITRSPITRSPITRSPITRSATNLRANLRARARLVYPDVQHILICDAADQESQAACRETLTAAQGWALA
jgi:hypothetical protein